MRITEKKLSEFCKIDISCYLNTSTNDEKLIQELQKGIESAKSDVYVFVRDLKLMNSKRPFEEIKREQGRLADNFLKTETIYTEDTPPKFWGHRYLEREALIKIKENMPLEKDMIDIIIGLFSIKFYENLMNLEYQKANTPKDETTPSVSENNNIKTIHWKGDDEEIYYLFGQLHRLGFIVNSFPDTAEVLKIVFNMQSKVSTISTELSRTEKTPKNKAKLDKIINDLKSNS